MVTALAGNYLVTSTLGSCVSANSSPITINAVVCNRPPIAVDDNYSVSHLGTVTLTPLALDSDPDNNPLTITSINGTTLTPGTAQTIAVTGGTVNVSITGVITFTSNGTQTNVLIPYVISDVQGGTATANEIITVSAPVNNPPVAISDNYTTQVNVSVSLKPLDKDSDADGNTLTIISINNVPLTGGTSPQQIAVPNGTVTVTLVSGVQTIIFEPFANYTGTVTFPYVISDGTVTATANEVIEIKRNGLEIFNAVTPGDGDGKNDFFLIAGIENFPNNTVEIYNRWGVLVYEADGYNNADKSFVGESNGRVTIAQSTQLPEGTYFYIIKYADNGNQYEPKAGYLYINR